MDNSPMERPNGFLTPDGRIHSYRRIVVPLDGTSFAAAALNPAAGLAHGSRATLHLVTVRVEEAARAVTVEPTPPAPDEFLQDSVELEQHLHDLREWLAPELRLVVTEVLHDRSPGEALSRYAQRVEADLIVAATHSRGLIGRALLGSTSGDIIRSAPCPVLLVPASDSLPDPGVAPLQDAPRSVVAALDPSGDSDDAVLTQALTCTRLWGAQLHVVQVVPPTVLSVPATVAGAPMGIPVSSDQASLEHSASSRLRRTVESLQRRGFQCRSQVLTGARPADSLVAFAETLGSTLLVVGRHDRGLLERTLMGSESDRLARKAKSVALMVCPLG